MVFAVLIIVAYLFGSIPFGLIIAAAHGRDLRSIGSGNIGATNLSRALGRKWGYVCFVLDAAKGTVPMLIVGSFVTYPPSVSQLFLWLATGCAAILGHIFPIYVKFRGGKGVATSFGVALGLWPYYTICAVSALVIWAAAVLLWRYISLASIVASIAFPATVVLAIVLIPGWNFSFLWPLLVTAIIIPVVVIVRHRENIGRLFAGTEGKILQKQTYGN